MTIQESVHANDTDLETHTERKIYLGDRFEESRSTEKFPLNGHKHSPFKRHVHFISIRLPNFSVFTISSCANK